MNVDDFWCRAFLAAMGGEYVTCEDGVRWENHGAPAAYCERAADAALAVAQRRGMVTGALPETGQATAAPTLERVEFTAERSPGRGWTLFSAACHGGLVVSPGDDVINMEDGSVLRIKWAESMPPKPIEVSIERRAPDAGPAVALSDVRPPR